MAAKKKTIKATAKKKKAKATTRAKKVLSHKTQILAELKWSIAGNASSIVWLEGVTNFIGPIYLRMWPGLSGGNDVERVYGIDSGSEILPVEGFESTFLGLPPGGDASIGGYFHSPHDASIDVKLTFTFKGGKNLGSLYDLTIKRGWNPFLIPVKLIK